MTKRTVRRKRSRSALSVFGLGPRGLPQLTLETLEAMKLCEEVYGRTLFQESLSAFCRKLNIPFKGSNWGQYFACPHSNTKPGRVGPDKGIVQRITARLGKGGRIGLFVDGNPSLFGFTSNLVRRCRARGYRCDVYAAVSSLDQLMDPVEAAAGLQFDLGVTACNALHPNLKSIHFNRHIGLLLYNLGHLFRSSAKRYNRLVDRLCSLYGDRRKTFLIECTPDGDVVRPSSLKDLSRQLKLVGPNATLYLPRS